MQDFLSISQRSSLKSAHRMQRDRKTGDRMKVVLRADQGESFVEILKFLFINVQTARLRAILANGNVPTAQTAAEKSQKRRFILKNH